jgi:hypothetical protein
MTLVSQNLYFHICFDKHYEQQAPSGFKEQKFFCVFKPEGASFSSHHVNCNVRALVPQSF